MGFGLVRILILLLRLVALDWSADPTTAGPTDWAAEPAVASGWGADATGAASGWD